MSTANRHTGRSFDPLPYEITRLYPGQFIIFSEEQQRVIGAAVTMEEATRQAEASGVTGQWHYGYGEAPEIPLV